MGWGTATRGTDGGGRRGRDQQDPGGDELGTHARGLLVDLELQPADGVAARRPGTSRNRRRRSPGSPC
ncbi:MAG: hypothetical protein M0C28_27280 [Candidatus Moduliflexus flocculans]|nr:hypothetical protein [Candidatus Moduliflexus flocculans]